MCLWKLHNNCIYVVFITSIIILLQNGTIFREQYAQYLNDSIFSDSSLEDVYSETCYDATWALAYALNDTLTGRVFIL